MAHANAVIYVAILLTSGMLKCGIRNRKFHNSIENNWEHFIAGHSRQEWKQLLKKIQNQNDKSVLWCDEKQRHGQNMRNSNYCQHK